MKSLKVFASTLMICLLAVSFLTAQTGMTEGLTYDVEQEGEGEKVVDGKEVEFRVWAHDADGGKMFYSDDLGFTFHHTVGTAEDNDDKMMEKSLKEMQEGAIYVFTVKKEQIEDMPQEEKDKLPGDHVTYKMEVVAVTDAQANGAELIEKTIKEEGVEAASLLVESLKKDNPENYSMHQDQINWLGYELMSEGKMTEAQVVFTINTDLYPESSNAFDSLGDAYAAKENKEKAIECYEKAVELDPDNEYSKEKLEKLTSGETDGK